MAPTIKEYNDLPNIIYMTSDNIWDPSDIQLPHHASVIGPLKCNHPEKYTDNSEYYVLTGRIYTIYTARLAEGLSYEAATVSVITTKYLHSKVDAKTLPQIWSSVWTNLFLGQKQGHPLSWSTMVYLTSYI